MDALVITLDIDWAPDFVLEHVARKLTDRGLKATWFVTHDSPLIRKMIADPGDFEFGLHPNFLTGTTQGNDHREVLTSVKRLVPDSRIMRTHGLVQSTETLRLAANEFGIEIDLSLLLPGQTHLQPHVLNLNRGGTGIIRVPYFWEDDIESCSPQPSWTIRDDRFHQPGLRVFDFHPVHVYLNTEAMDRYHALKQYGPLSELRPQQMDPHVNREARGTGVFFEELLDEIASHQRRSYTVSDVVSIWRGES